MWVDVDVAGVDEDVDVACCRRGGWDCECGCGPVM